MYDRTTVQGATFNMHGQLYCGHANATALSSSPVVSALGFELDDPGSSPRRGKKKCELRFYAWLNLYIIIKLTNEWCHFKLVDLHYWI